jgi:hypothetical protein
MGGGRACEGEHGGQQKISGHGAILYFSRRQSIR